MISEQSFGIMVDSPVKQERLKMCLSKGLTPFIPKFKCLLCLLQFNSLFLSSFLEIKDLFEALLEYFRH